MTTIIFAHPWHGSFNKAILDTITNTLSAKGEAFQIIDLHKDGFRSDFTEKELSVYNQGMSLDPLVAKYQEIIKKTSRVVFIFPIWWSTMPAILKGFFDKVLLYGFAFNYENGWSGLLKIEDGLVITTSESATDDFRNSIEGNFIPSMLNSVGIHNVKWLNCDKTSTGTLEHRQNFLTEVENRF